MRRVAVHFWPADQNAPAYAACTAASSFASSATISGLWPPSSSWTRLPSDAARSRTPWPTGTEPVNEIAGHPRVVHERLADLAAAADHDVEHALGKLGLLERASEMQSGQRRVLRELQHHRVAVRERRRQLPRRDRRREVPRRDQPDDPERSPARVHARPGRRLLEHLTHRAPALAREEPEDLRRAGRLHARLPQRLAHLAGHVLRDVLHACFDRLGGADQDRASLCRGQRRPLRERSDAAATAESTSSAPELGNSPTTSDGRHGLCRSYVRPPALAVHRPATKLAAPGAIVVSAIVFSPPVTCGFRSTARYLDTPRATED